MRSAGTTSSDQLPIVVCHLVVTMGGNQLHITYLDFPQGSRGAMVELKIKGPIEKQQWSRTQPTAPWLEHISNDMVSEGLRPQPLMPTTICFESTSKLSIMFRSCTLGRLCTPTVKIGHMRAPRIKHAFNLLVHGCTKPCSSIPPLLLVHAREHERHHSRNGRGQSWAEINLRHRCGGCSDMDTIR